MDNETDPQKHEHLFMEAKKEAKKSLCLRGFCGAVIVKDGEVIGRGYNAPPGDDLSIRRCHRKHEIHPNFKSDKTCCVHAEWRAVLDALREHPEKVPGADLYFIRVKDVNGDEIEYAGAPYCTHCSRLALDVGIRSFGLWHKEGICMYETHDYNERSFAYQGE